MLCFKKFTVAKIIVDKAGGESKFFLEIFLSHSAESFPQDENLWCFINFG